MILVTGATGFLGKHVCAQLKAQNMEFVPTSLSLGTDLRNAQETEDLFHKVKPAYVLHCASFVGGIQFGLKHLAEIYQNGMLMQINLFDMCYRYHVKRLVNPISNCAYPGDATFFKESEFWNGPLHESVRVYGMVRKMSYIGSIAHREQYGLDTINLILSNMYGPGDHFDEERSHALGALIKKFADAKNNGTSQVTVWGTGKPVREWLHVDDGAKAMIKALNVKTYKDPINIGVGKGISIKDMTEVIKKYLGYDGNVVFDTTKIDGAPYKTMDGTLGKKLLHWEPEIAFQSGVKETIDWYIANS